MATITKTDVRFARQRFRQRYGKEVTPQAGRLVRELLNTLADDPHPRWHASPLQRRQLTEKLLDQLPAIFEMVSETERSGKIVSAPDVLHWLGIRIPEQLRTLGFAFDKE